MPQLDASALEEDVDGVALLSAALGISMPELVLVSPIVTPSPAHYVLVVERDRLLRESISIQLHRRGHVVLEADTGEQARAILRGGQRVGVLVTEMDTAAGPDGWALADEARMRHPAVAVIYTSAQGAELSCTGPGVLFVEKPYRTEQIVNAIDKLTSRAPNTQIKNVLARASDVPVLAEAA